MLASLSEAFHPIAARTLEKMEIQTINNDRVLKHEEGKVFLKSGKTIECECYLPCHPMGGNGSAFMPQGSTDDRGYVKVNDYLQCDNPNYPKVFALGDW